MSDAFAYAELPRISPLEWARWTRNRASKGRRVSSQTLKESP